MYDADAKAALKHTPLYPHHPLIASRLLREPTLLAQIPPYPNLIGVQGWLRTPDGFYLIEDLPEGYVPLPALVSNPGELDRTMAKSILDQLVSVVRDGLHEGGRVCHRDLKGENCLVHPYVPNAHVDLTLTLSANQEMSFCSILVWRLTTLRPNQS